MILGCELWEENPLALPSETLLVCVSCFCFSAKTKEVRLKQCCVIYGRKTVREQLHQVLADLSNALLFFGKYSLETLEWSCQHTKEMVFRLSYGQVEQFVRKEETQPEPLAYDY